MSWSSAPASLEDLTIEPVKAICAEPGTEEMSDYQIYG